VVGTLDWGGGGGVRPNPHISHVCRRQSSVQEGPFLVHKGGGGLGLRGSCSAIGWVFCNKRIGGGADDSIIYNGDCVVANQLEIHLRPAHFLGSIVPSNDKSWPDDVSEVHKKMTKVEKIKW
jgi:hypothetical protein